MKIDTLNTITMKNLLFLIFTFTLFNLNAQKLNNKQLQKFVDSLNENVEMIQNNRLNLSELSDTESDEFYDMEIETFLSPFWNYDFEILEPFNIAENGDLSMKVKYLPEDDEAFIYSVKGNLKDLERAVEDIYFILEFSDGTLLETYEYLDSGKTEQRNDMLIHFGIDQNDLMKSAQKAGIQTDDY